MVGSWPCAPHPARWPPWLLGPGPCQRPCISAWLPTRGWGGWAHPPALARVTVLAGPLTSAGFSFLWDMVCAPCPLAPCAGDPLLSAPSCAAPCSPWTRACGHPPPCPSTWAFAQTPSLRSDTSLLWARPALPCSSLSCQRLRAEMSPPTVLPPRGVWRGVCSGRAARFSESPEQDGRLLVLGPAGRCWRLDRCPRCSCLFSPGHREHGPASFCWESPRSCPGPSEPLSLVPRSPRRSEPSGRLARAPVRQQRALPAPSTGPASAVSSLSQSLGLKRE